MEKKSKVNILKSFVKKNSVLLVSIFIVIALVAIYFLYSDYEDRELVKNINNHYGKYIKVTRKSVIYDKNKKKIGYVNKGFTFELENKKIDNINDKYFRVKNTNYYLFYKNVFKVNKKIKDDTNSNYLLFNKNVESNKTDFYIKDKKILTLEKKLSLPIYYIDDNYYYVLYLDRIMQVKKISVKIKDVENTKDKESNYISVINYDKIYDKKNSTCNEENCIDIAFVKENIKSLKDNGYYTISLDEYNNWINDKIRLKEKAVLLTISNNSDLVDNIVKEENIKIENISSKDLKIKETNSKNTKENKNYINLYKIKQNNTLDEFIKMINGETVVVRKKEVVSKSKGIPVLNYHFFYDPNIGEECNENICLQTDAFRKQLDYFRDNGYKTLKMEEFKQWMYGEIELPEKSVLITIDDGAMGTSKINGNKLIPILEEYKMNATLFLITEWWKKSDYESSYLDVESHGNDIHITGSCGKAKIHCLSKQELIDDFKLSIQKVGTDTAFCFPFYAYNDTAIEAAKEVGFKIAFIGGNRKAKQSDNKFMIPRYPIYKSTSWQQFLNMVN